MGSKIVDGVLKKYTKEKGETGFIIPKDVKEIDWCAFENRTSIKSVIISNSITKIGSFAFSYCSNLKSIEIPDRVTKIGKKAFEECPNLTSVTIPDSVTTIEDYAFLGTPWLKDLCKNNDGFAIVNHILLKYIETEGVTDVVIPNDVTEINKCAFENCRNIKKIITKDFEIKINDSRLIHKQVCLIFLKDLSEEIPVEIKYNVIWQMFLQKLDDEELLEYIRKNFMKMFRFAIDNNDVETIFAVCKRKDLLTEKNIDTLIEYAIQHTRKGGTVEIQALLMLYKNENIGYIKRDLTI